MAKNLINDNLSIAIQRITDETEKQATELASRQTSEMIRLRSRILGPIFVAPYQMIKL